MNQIEKEDLEDFLSGMTEERHRVYAKYMDLYKESIEIKANYCKRFVNTDEVLSDAIMAINSAFEEIYDFYCNEIDIIESKINFKSIFNRHLSKHVRINELENRPLSQTIKIDFHKTVSKTNKKDIYADYYNSNPIIEGSDLNNASEIGLVNNDYSGSEENMMVAEVKQLVDFLTPEKDSDGYKDVCDRFVDNKTLQQIADDPRNDGVRRQTIHKRIFTYIEKLKKKKLALDLKSGRI